MNRILATLLVIMLSFYTYGDSSIAKVGNIIVPPTFAALLREGMPLPVYLSSTIGSDGYTTNEQVATATIQLKENAIFLVSIDFSENNTAALVSKDYIEKTKLISDIAFDNSGSVNVDNESQIKLDFSKLHLKVYIPEESFSATTVPRATSIGDSSIQDVTGILNYNLGISGMNINKSIDNDNIANYLSVNSVISQGVNHLELDMAYYGIGTLNSSSDLHRAMFERDFNNHRLSVGMLSGWDLQSLGQVSGVNAGRIYGVSYGNQSSSKIIDESLSLTPIYAFLPAEGEVRLLKDGKLVNIQNLPIGSHEVSTKMLPSGVYDVDVEVYVNGLLVSSNRQRVNKSVIGPRNGSGLSWQVWGGAAQPVERTRENKENLPDTTHLLGVSAASSIEEVYFSGSGYLYNDVGIVESNTNFQVNNFIDVNISTVNATDSTWRVIGNTNIRIEDIGTIWLSYEKGNVEQKVYMYESDNYSYGASINLSKWWDGGGNLSFSKRINNTTKSESLNVDYNQHLYTGAYGTLSLRASYQEEDGYNDSYSDKSIALNYSIPFGNIFSLGASRNHIGNTTVDVGVSKAYRDGLIRYAGVNVSKVIENSEGNHEDFSANGNASYNTKYSKGNVAATRSGNGNWGANIVSHGSIAFSENTLAASGGNNGDAGIVINTGLDDDSTMIARVNNSEVKLRGGNNFISVPAYQRYKVELMNSRDTKSSFEFKNSNEMLTLYPGNVAVLNMQDKVKELVTVFGIIKAEDGSVLASARVNNHIGSTVTDLDGNFVIDVDRKYPTIMFSALDGNYCEADLAIDGFAGAAWVGDVICKGLSTYVSN